MNEELQLEPEEIKKPVVKNDEFKLDEQSAKLELERIEEEFTTTQAEHYELIFYLIRKGKLYLNEKREITLELEKPLEMERGRVISKIELSELNFDQYSQIKKSVKFDIPMSGKTNRSIEMHMAMEMEELRRLLFIQCGLSDGEIGRIKKRDVDSLMAIQSFLV